MLGRIGTDLVLAGFHEAASHSLRWNRTFGAATDLLGADGMLLDFGNQSAIALNIVEAIGFNAYASNAHVRNQLDQDELIRESIEGASHGGCDKKR